ncbi:MAG TPA: FecR family protein [Polyangiales bacterium]|nr:FecR family protein [Polyangiales bacterium]
MSSDERELSQDLRERVAALYESQPSAAGRPLGRDAQRRVIDSLQLEAARLPLERRRRRAVAITTAVLAAAASWLLVLRPAQDVQPPVATAPSQPSAPIAPPCGLPLIAQEPTFEALADGRRVLDMGTFGQLTLGPGARLRVEQSGACELRVRLESGELAGDLHNLRPARLLVQTDQGSVVVTGTRFVVRSGDDDFEVVLATGVVDVVFADRSSLRLAPGMRLHKPRRAPQPETRPLSDEDVRFLTRLLRGEPSAEPARVPVKPAAAPKPPSTASLLDQAEGARRAGQTAEAREAYRAASQRRDDSGEVALLRWVRLELDAADPPAALRVLEQHRQRFARGRLGAEAGWLQVQVQQALHRPDRARAAARKLGADYPGTPQAAAAAKVLDSP